MDSQLELLRRTHEEIDQLERASATQLLKKNKLHKDQLLQEHRVDRYLQSIKEKSVFLLELYNDKDGSLAKEVQVITGAQEFVSFYQKLKVIKDHYKAIGNESVKPFDPDQNTMDLDYEMAELSAALGGLFAGFEAQQRAEFEKLWDEGKVPSWPKLDINDALFCIPCKKQFTKQTLFDAHLPGKKHQKALKNGKVDLETSTKDLYDSNKPIAWLEFYAVSLTAALKTVRNDTRSYVERKQTLTEKERMEEVDEVPVEIENSDDEVEDKLYNPLKLPIGWDGKPIPYWLFKIHGLGIPHPCEICGGYVYMGRKAFERHFQEWRHTHGLKCLGIQNSRLYYDITQIQDAVALAETLANKQQAEESFIETMEEFEDAEGNVFSKKTYQDLKRQGLL